MWKNEVALLKVLVCDLEQPFGVDPTADIDYIDNIFTNRGFVTLCREMKAIESEIVTSMARGTPYTRNLFRSLFIVSPPSARIASGFLAKFDSGLTDSKLIAQSWLAAVENESRLGKTSRSSNTTRWLSTFADKYLPSNSEPDIQALLPRHGSGAVAERLDANAKFGCDFMLDIHEIDSSFLPTSRPVRTSSTARFFCVPKDATKLRAISIEPCGRQYLQQACRRALVSHIETCRISRWVDIRKPELNGLAASSRTCATLDLENASDSVPCWQVYTLFKNWPNFRRILFSVRSSGLVNDSDVLSLKRYAGMGNATTFVVESLIFLAIVLGKLRDLQPRFRNINLCAGVRVYGDDIVIPNNAFAGSVLDALVESGYIPSSTKTCICGDFKESCGQDYYRGILVNSPRLRHPLSAYVCVQDMRDLVSRLRYWGAKQTLLMLYRLKTNYPEVQQALFGKHDRDLHYVYNSDLQAMMVRVTTRHSKQLRLTGERGLLSYFTCGSAIVGCTKVRLTTQMQSTDVIFDD